MAFNYYLEGNFDEIPLVMELAHFFKLEHKNKPEKSRKQKTM